MKLVITVREAISDMCAFLEGYLLTKFRNSLVTFNSVFYPWNIFQRLYMLVGIRLHRVLCYPKSGDKQVCSANCEDVMIGFNKLF